MNWVARLPRRWPVVPLRRVLRSVEQGWSPVAEDRLADDGEWGVIKLSAVSPAGFASLEHKALAEGTLPERRFEIREGDVLLTRANTPDLVGEACVVRCPRPHLMLCDLVYRLNLDLTAMDPRYFVYWLGSRTGRAQIEADARGSSQSMVKVSQGHIRSWLTPTPPASEQHAIADLLDRKTAAIDALIEKKERLVIAAEEQRATLIGQVVLGSLSTAKRRDTGTPLGAIPEHWTAKRLMHLTAPGRPIMYGIVLPGPNVDEGVPIIKSGNCTGETLRPELLHKTTFEIEAGYARSRVAKDDIVYAIRGSVGMAALVQKDVAGANLTQDAARIAPAPNVNPRWLLYAVQSAPVWMQLAAGIVGATVKGINIRDLKRPFIPVPPREEQDETAAYLDAEVGKLHDLEAATVRSIEQLREYRQGLITAAVTGQLDVAAQEAA